MATSPAAAATDVQGWATADSPNERLQSAVQNSRQQLPAPAQKKKKSTPGAAAAGSRKPQGSSNAGSKASAAAAAPKRRSTSAAAPSVATSRGSKAKSSASSSRRSGRAAAKKKPSGKAGGRKRVQLNWSLVRAQLDEEESAERAAVAAEEELALDAYQPLYNVLVMEIVQLQLQCLNARQLQLNETITTMNAAGVHSGAGAGDAARDGDGSGAAAADAVLDRLREKLHGDAVAEKERLQEEVSGLRSRLDDRTLELEKKTAELEVMRGTMSRRLARTEVEIERVRAEAQGVLQESTMDVDRMKKELGHRIDIATSALRSPSYGTALRSLQELAAEAQTEIQAHHDRVSQLIVSIGAKDTFRKDSADSMHTNLPTRYRTGLRGLEKDQLLNLLDVLSFQDGVVETVGKALFVLSQSEYQTSVI